MKLKYEFVTQNIGGKTVAVAVGSGAGQFNGLINLNKTGAFVFDLLRDDVTVDQIVARMAASFDADPQQLRTDAEAFLSQLESAGVLER